MNVQRTSRRRLARRTAATVVSVATLAIAASPAFAAPPSTAIGPNTTTAPYVLPVADDVRITSLLTVGDAGAASNGYELVGVPDGIGLSRHDDKVVVYLNQELRDTQGLVRRHGATGSFVSRWVIDPRTLEVKAGADLIDPGVRFWDYPNGTYVTAGARFADLVAQDVTFGRFCSGTLSDPGVFYDEHSGRGYRGQIYFANEEDGDNGRTFAVTADGRATALPRSGLFSYENTIPADTKGRTTVVMGDEDGPGDGSQLRVYVGTKQSFGDPVARAGLTNGFSYVIDAVNAAVTDDAGWRATYGKGVPAPVNLVNVPWSLPGALQNTLAQDRRPQPQPDRGRDLRPATSERLLLRHDRRRPDRAVPVSTRGTAAASGACGSRTSTSPSTARR